MYPEKILLPRGFMLPGIILILAGIAITIIRFWVGIKPEFLEFNTFAVFSVYLDSKHLQIISNNMSEEIAGVLLLTGLFILCLIRERNESELVSQLRIKAFIFTVYIEFFFLIFSFLFTYGFAFIYMVIINVFVPFIVYILVFQSLLFLNSRK
jgi:hypothetical protein